MRVRQNRTAPQTHSWEVYSQSLIDLNCLILRERIVFMWVRAAAPHQRNFFTTTLQPSLSPRFAPVSLRDPRFASVSLRDPRSVCISANAFVSHKDVIQLGRDVIRHERPGWYFGRYDTGRFSTMDDRGRGRTWMDVEPCQWQWWGTIGVGSSPIGVIITTTRSHTAAPKNGLYTHAIIIWGDGILAIITTHAASWFTANISVFTAWFTADVVAAHAVRWFAANISVYAVGFTSDVD